MDRYAFDADLAATVFVTIVATEKGAPVADAVSRLRARKPANRRKREFV